jgi:hypothetical protein
MSKVLAGLQWQILLVYIDDIIAFSPTFERHLIDLQTIFDRLQQANLSLKPSKCEFGKDKIKFLGHEVSAKGISPVDDKIKIIKEAKPPTTVKGVRQFLGLAGYYRKHILNFSTIAAPLTDLTKGVTISKAITWTPECQKAFHTLKYALTHAPILAYPNYSQPFILTTDASNCATGAILSQIRDNKEVVIAYGGRKLSQAEQKYTATERECLHIIEGLREFEPYIRGRSVKILTDHAALKWILTQKQPPGRLARWLAYLQSFSFQVELLSCSKIPHADAISRQLQDTDSDVTLKDHRKPSHLVIDSHTIQNIAQPPIRTEIDDFLDDKLLINAIETANLPQLPFIATTTKARRRLATLQEENKIEYPDVTFTPDILRTLQLKDSLCKVYIDYLEQGNLPADDNLSKRVVLSNPP